MLISRKKFNVLAIVTLVVYSFCYVKFENPISDILNKTINLSDETTINFFESIKNLYDNLFLQFGFRILIFILNIWLFKWCFYGFSKIERKIFSKRNLKVDIEKIKSLAYDIALLNLFQYFCLTLCAIGFGRQLIMVNYIYFVALQLAIIVVKIVMIYIPFISKTKIIITPLMIIIISSGLSIVGVMLK